LIIFYRRVSKAESEHKVFRERQDREYVSDFDREVKRLTKKNRRVKKAA